MYTTDQYEGMLAETITVQGHNGDVVNAYLAKPLGAGPFPGMVLIHHAPGWDEFYRETARRFAHHGYITISPNLYQRNGHGDPVEIAGKVRESGGISDDQALGDEQIGRRARLSRKRVVLADPSLIEADMVEECQIVQIVVVPFGKAPMRRMVRHHERSELHERDLLRFMWEPPRG